MTFENVVVEQSFIVKNQLIICATISFILTYILLTFTPIKTVITNWMVVFLIGFFVVVTVGGGMMYVITKYTQA